MMKVKALKNGPYLIEGEGKWKVVIEGEEKTVEQTTIALCRCGHSKNKPFCDGSHKTVGFEADACELNTES